MCIRDRIDFKLNNSSSFFPLMWSNDPWETPIVKIKSKHRIDDIFK